MFNVCIITPEFPPHLFGGIGSLVNELANGLAKRNVDVTVIAPAYSDYFLIERNLKVYFLLTPKLRPQYFYFQLYNKDRVRKIIEKSQPDIIHLHTPSNIIVKSIKNFLEKSKLVIHFHGSPASYRSWDALKSLDVIDISWFSSMKFYNKLECLQGEDPIDYAETAIHVAKHVMFYNMFTNSRLRSIKNVVVYPGVNSEEIAKLSGLYKEQYMNKKSFVFIFGARLMRYKGVMHLLQAFHKSFADNPHVELKMYGDGPLKSHVIRYIASKGLKNVKYLGKAPRLKFLEELAKADVLVHPSFYEAAPMTVIEAIALAKPVIANKALWSEEFIEELGLGVTVDVKNVSDFAFVLQEVVEENIHLAKGILSSRKGVLKKFEAETMIDDILKVYSSS